MIRLRIEIALNHQDARKQKWQKKNKYQQVGNKNSNKSSTKWKKNYKNQHEILKNNLELLEL
jgi:hypothetical protein